MLIYAETLCSLNYLLLLLLLLLQLQTAKTKMTSQERLWQRDLHDQSSPSCIYNQLLRIPFVLEKSIAGCDRQEIKYAQEEVNHCIQ